MGHQHKSKDLRFLCRARKLALATFAAAVAGAPACGDGAASERAQHVGSMGMQLTAPISGCMEVTAESEPRNESARFLVQGGVEELHVMSGLPLTAVTISARLYDNSTCEGAPLYLASAVSANLSPEQPEVDVILSFIGNGSVNLGATFEGSCPMTPVTSAPPTSSHGLTYDARKKLVLLVTGSEGPGAGSSTLYAFDVTRRTWARIETRGPAPTARSVPGFAYDYSTGKSVLFGGTGEPGTPRDVWEFDWSQCGWQDRTPAELPLEWPSFRWGPGMTYDFATEHVIITTGIQNPTYQWETDPADASVYEWNSPSGTFTVRPPLGTPPFDRGAAVLVGDPIRRVVYLFAGLQENEVIDGPGDTNLYVWDGSNGTWSVRSPNPAPSARLFHAAYFDRVADRFVTTGGLWYGWLWTPEYWQYDPDADSWSLLHTDAAHNRFWSPTAYDEDNGVAVQFGGLLADPVYYGSGPSGPVGDTRLFATGGAITTLGLE